ncbi:MAG: sigma-70 family RNA polymerase sigma factor [Phycisphaerales bacterium]|nr:sigma-70 family RNA polymerase sigma factor [Phycisphaerales bacterium]
MGFVRPIPTTTTQLLNDLRDTANQQAWYVFDQRYKPIIHAVAMRLGLRAEDAADVAQQTITDFLRDYRRGQYDRGKGRLRDWLRGIARNRAIDVLRADGRGRAKTAGDDIEHLAEDGQVNAIWEQEEKAAIVAAAMEELRAGDTSANVIKAFELGFLRKMPVEQVAVECGMSIDSVHQSRTRVVKRLNAIVKRLSDAYAEDW